VGPCAEPARRRFFQEIEDAECEREMTERTSAARVLGCRRASSIIFGGALAGRAWIGSASKSVQVFGQRAGDGYRADGDFRDTSGRLSQIGGTSDFKPPGGGRLSWSTAHSVAIGVDPRNGRSASQEFVEDRAE